MFYVFDWDGTLSDSTDRIASCIQDAAQEVGLPALAHAEVKNIIGLGMREAVNHLYPQIEEQQMHALAARYSQLFVQRDSEPSPFYPQVIDTLRHLKEMGATLAVATGKNRVGLDRILRRHDMLDFFDCSRCADETQSKPHPLMLDELLHESGFDREDAVMVGDTEWDMRMADNAGMRKIAVDYGAHSRDRLMSLEPDMLISGFAQLLEWRW